ncbi:MAG: tRNA ((37)-N(1))-methyltransferase [Myxococcaceae bacterium]|nr:tRNA ((37)-N(1))-methyltransferase [Myxococcaceae bacterium]
MDVYLVALFPEVLDGFARSSIVGRAVTQNLVRFHGVQIRDFSPNKHHTVDDAPYGGGSGMVMTAPSVVGAIESLPVAAETGAPPHRILMSPTGRPFTQAIARELSAKPALAFVCGRYEGVDERVRAYVDDELSLGDFVLTGGEPAALAMIDAVVRLLPGALGNAESASTESHGDDGMLEYPQYTRPVDFRGALVPEVLRCGDHARVARWRRWHSLRRTRERRPDLFARAALGRADLKLIDGDEP